MVRAIAAALLASLAAGCGVPTGEARTVPGDAGEDAEDDSVLVRLGEFDRGDISMRLSVAADLEPVREANVYPEISGVVEEVSVEEGQAVEADAPVIRLVDEDRALTVRAREIALDRAKGELRRSELALREGRLQLEQKRLMEEEAEAQYRRLERLAEGEQSVVSAEELEAQLYTRRRARLDVQALELQVAKYELERDRADMDVRAAQVELKTARRDLERTVIRSPVRGHVSELDLKPGERVTPSTLAFHVVDTTALRARLHVPQRELRRLREGQTVELGSETWPGKTFSGTVAIINPVIDSQNGTVRVTVRVDDAPELRPGMFVSGEIVLDTRRDVLLVPKRAVSYENREPVLFLVEDGVARRYTLIPGYSDASRIEVEGLQGGDGVLDEPPGGRLVLVGHDNLEDGSRVEVEPGTASG